MLIREAFLAMAEHGLAEAWRKVSTKQEDKEFANQKNKGEGKLPLSRGIQDYLYNMRLIKIALYEVGQDKKELQDFDGWPILPWTRGHTDFDTTPKLNT